MKKQESGLSGKCGQNAIVFDAEAAFVEYMRSIFGNDEEIHCLADLRHFLEEQAAKSVDMSRTSVDWQYRAVEGAKAERMEIRNEEIKRVRVPYLDKCRAVGKLGPLQCKMDVKRAFGNWVARSSVEVHLDDDVLDVTCKSQLGSIMGNTCVFKGAWYYEVQILSNTIIKLGWVSFV